MNNEIPTSSDAGNKGVAVVYDLCTLPHGMSSQQMMDIIRKHKVVFWNSKEYPEAGPPVLVEGILNDGIKEPLRIVDINDEPELFTQLTNSCNDKK